MSDENATATLTLRLPPTLKVQIEAAARASDRTTTTWLLRAAKEKMAPRCIRCDRGVDRAYPATDVPPTSPEVDAGRKLGESLLCLVGYEQAVLILSELHMKRHNERT